MKHQHFKITDATLFVYRSKTNSKPLADTDPTDPTTTMVTLTKTGILQAGRPK
jgi:hypothetical protein